MFDFGPRILLLGLIFCVSVGNSIIFFADTESKAIFSELITIVAACSAVLLATAITFRQSIHAAHGKSYLSLAIGLVLWLCADIIWAAYELYFHVAAPIPSLSDILWLSGYPFFAYNLFLTYKEFKKRINKKILFATIIGNTIFLGYLISLTINLLDLSSPGGIAMFTIIIAYPISNAILTIPAFPILLGVWKEKPWSIPWIFKALSLCCIVVTVSWFAFIVITGLQEQVWISSMLFGAEYLIMAGGLIWYNKFLEIYNNHSKSTTDGSGQVNPQEDDHCAATAVTSHKSPVKEAEKKDELMAATSFRTVWIKSKKRNIDVVVATAIIALVIGYGMYQSQNTSATQFISPSDGAAVTVKIGALLPLTGTLSSFGQSADVSLRVALSDINAQLSKNNSNSRVGLVIEDTKTDPSVALEKLKDLKSKGVRIVIGPATSAAVSAVKDYADQNGILILSPSSTATELATPNDNLFRFVPDDSHQTEAIAQRMWQDGIRVVVPIWRTDIFGEGLHSMLNEKFESLGGKVIEGRSYKPPTGDFAASLHRINFIFWEQDVRALDFRVNEAVKQYGASKVGVYIVAYDEIVPIMIQAERHPGLSIVRWYGSDGSALNANLVHNEDVADFAEKTSFINPIYAVDNDSNSRFVKVEHEVTKEIGHSHRSYAEVAYDALWVAALASDKVSNQTDINTLSKTLVETAKTYNGITGKTLLNDAGDRAAGSYDLWAITREQDHHEGSSNSSYEWKRVGTFHNIK